MSTKLTIYCLTLKLILYIWHCRFVLLVFLCTQRFFHECFVTSTVCLTTLRLPITDPQFGIDGNGHMTMMIMARTTVPFISLDPRFKLFWLHLTCIQCTTVGQCFLCAFLYHFLLLCLISYMLFWYLTTCWLYILSPHHLVNNCISSSSCQC